LATSINTLGWLLQLGVLGLGQCTPPKGLRSLAVSSRVFWVMVVKVYQSISRCIKVEKAMLTGQSTKVYFNLVKDVLGVNKLHKPAYLRD
jgi:hypothetical protein